MPRRPRDSSSSKPPPRFGPDASADRWDVVAEGQGDARGDAADAARAGAGAGTEAEEVLTVRQVAARIKAQIGKAFPEPFWMVGEVSNLKRHGTGHWYLQLVDDESGDPRRRASVSAKMWRDTVAKLFGPRGRLTKLLDPQDGLKLKVLVRPDFYVPRGEISFTIQDVDADVTLGDLDRQRREALANLQRDGALEWNKNLPRAAVPLVIGLITARDSAAENDFLHTLRSSGLGFQVLRCDARMQGTETSASVRGGLETLAAGSSSFGVPEVIVIARGGGSRLDLSWFDREDIARAVATCPVPVLTGIGHEIDTSVADAVAHRAFKTPTAVAEQLVTTARDAMRGSEDAWAGILQSAGQTLRDGEAALVDTARRSQQAVTAGIAGASESLVHTGQRIRAGAERLLGDQQHELRAAAVRLTSGSHLVALPRHADRLEADLRRLALVARSRLTGTEQSLEVAENRCRLLDPAAVLRRGYSLLRRPDGRLLMDAADVAAGDAVSARLRDGELELTITDRRLDPAEPGPDPTPGTNPS